MSPRAQHSIVNIREDLPPRLPHSEAGLLCPHAHVGLLDVGLVFEVGKDVFSDGLSVAKLSVSETEGMNVTMYLLTITLRPPF